MLEADVLLGQGKLSLVDGNLDLFGLLELHRVLLLLLVGAALKVVQHEFLIFFEFLAKDWLVDDGVGVGYSDGGLEGPGRHKLNPGLLLMLGEIECRSVRVASHLYPTV